MRNQIIEMTVPTDTKQLKKQANKKHWDITREWKRAVIGKLQILHLRPGRNKNWKKEF